MEEDHKKSDTSLKALEQIYSDFASFCKDRGKVSEADTRAKIIDRILADVLYWPEADLIREENVNEGFIDYLLKAKQKNFLVLEAKKVGSSFELPVSSEKTKKLKISGIIRKNKPLYDAVLQAQSYAIKTGAKYAVVTNGYSWVVFIPKLDGMPWEDGDALVFPTAKFIKENFIQFWNALRQALKI